MTRRKAFAGAAALAVLVLVLAYNRHAIADLSKTDFDEVQLAEGAVLSKASGDPFSGTLQARGADIARLGDAIFAGTPAERWIDADPEGLILEVSVAKGELSGAAQLFADLRSDVVGELKSGPGFTLARWFSPRQRVASATFVAGKLEGRAQLWRPVGEELELRKYVEAEFQGNRMHGAVRRFHDNGKLHSEMRFESGLPLGEQKEFYATGELAQESQVSANGMEIKGYYRQGQQRSHRVYKFGTLRSLRTWFPDGSKRSHMSNPDRVLDTDTRWYSNGQMAYELLDTGPEEYPAHGVIRQYHDSGALKSEHKYDKGVLEGPFQIFYDDEKLWEEGSYAGGELDGRHRKWWKNGTLALDANWNAGQKDGSYERWYASGKLWEKADYKAGKRVGPYLKRWKNGKLAHEYEYVNGAPEGTYTTFYDNGQARLQATYKNGRLHGEYKNWLKDGSVYELATYESGTKVESSLEP